MDKEEKKELAILRREKIERLETDVKKIKEILDDLTSISANLVDRIEYLEGDEIIEEVDEEVNRIYG